MTEKIAVLGSTGSVNTQTLEVVRYNKDIQVTALATSSDTKLMEEQIREFKPGLACLWDEKKAKELRAAVADLDVKAANGMEGLMEAATSSEADLVVTAAAGMIGIHPVIAVIEAGKDIAPTSKETLVTTGHIIMPLTREKGVKLLPVDLEHSVIFWCLQGAAGNPLHKILLTTSGGPFRGFTKEQLRQVRLKDTLRHPNQPMGHKITTDSSIMVNKGLEAMGAHWLLRVEIDQVQVVVQPANVIHSMVEFEDGVVIVQLGTPNVKLPTQYTLYYPERRLLPGDRLNFEKLIKISFKVPDMEVFRGFRLAYEAGRRGDTLLTVSSAANRMVVAMFLERKINYLAIADMVEGVMEHRCAKPSPDVAQIPKAEREAYDYLSSKWN